METSISNGDNGDVHPLFGGAFSCFIPKNAIDSSTVREIPDNQEVFCHSVTDQSLMIDILEYQSHVQGVDAASYHFKDLVEANSAGKYEIILVESIPKGNVCLTECSDAWFLSGRQMVSKFKEETTAANVIDLHLVLYRLPQHETDMMIIFNNPSTISKDSSSSHSLPPNSGDGWSLEMFKQIACSLTMHNSGIFGEE